MSQRLPQRVRQRTAMLPGVRTRLRAHEQVTKRAEHLADFICSTHDGRGVLRNERARLRMRRCQSQHDLRRGAQLKTIFRVPRPCRDHQQVLGGFTVRYPRRRFQNFAGLLRQPLFVHDLRGNTARGQKLGIELGGAAVAVVILRLIEEAAADGVDQLRDGIADLVGAARHVLVGDLLGIGAVVHRAFLHSKLRHGHPPFARWRKNTGEIGDKGFGSRTQWGPEVALACTVR